MAAKKDTIEMVVFTAPSGAGKTTIVKHIVSKYTEIFQFSVSATTRDKRDYEEDGIDYYFISKEEFHSKISNKEFIEWEEVYGNQYYGTLHSEVDRIARLNKKVIFDIDVHGASAIKEKYGNKCLTVFVKPPPFTELIKRLENRKTEDELSFRKRINRITKELLFEDSFDHVILNDILKETLYTAERLIEEKVVK